MSKQFPPGWTPSILADTISNIEAGTSVNSEDRPKEDGEFGILKTSAASGGRFLPHEYKTVRNDEVDRLACPVRKNTIIVSRMNTKALVGESGFVREDHDDLFLPDRLWALKPSPNVSPNWLGHLIASPRLRAEIGVRATGTSATMKNISQDALLGIPIELPPLPEQRRIAAILDEWDQAITTAEKLAKAKLVRKDGLAHKLLDLCLVDHPPQGWVTAHLGDLFEERTTVGGSARLLAVTAGQGIINRDETGRKDTSADDKSSYKLIEPGDIGYNTMRMWQGVSALSSLRGLVSPAYTVVRPNANVDAQFAAQLFKYHHMIHTFWRYSQGLVDDTLMLKFPQFSEIKINMPPLDVQKETGEILSGADLEVGQLQDLRNKLRLQKSGLMQKLLSGEWPVPASIDRLLPGGQDIDEAVGAEVQRAEATG